MDANNVLIAAVVGGFLYIGGYLVIAKLAIGIAFLMGVASLAKKAKKSKETNEETDNDNVMDPIEIETKWKPEYTIPSDITMDLSTDKSPRGAQYYKGIKGTFGAGAKFLGKKLKEDD